MAQLDANIFLQQKGPDFEQIGDGFERGMRLGDMMRERKAKDLEMQKQNAIRDAYKSGVINNPDGTQSFNSEMTLGALMKVDPKAAFEFKQQQAANLKSDLESQYAKNSMISSLLDTVKDQDSYLNAKAYAISKGIKEAEQMPNTYDPQIINSLRAQYQKASLTPLQQIEDQRKREETALKYAELRSKRESAPPKLTVGQEAADREVGKDLANAPQDQASFDKNMQRLLDARAKIAARKNDYIPTSGRIIGRVPDFLLPEDNVFLRQEVQGAAQGGLRAALGSQFTEKEGERIMAASYDEKLSPEKNLEKIDLAINELRTQKALKDQLLNELSQKGTVSQMRLQKPIPIRQSDMPSKPQTIKQGGHTYTLNPQTGEYE